MRSYRRMGRPIGFLSGQVPQQAPQAPPFMGGVPFQQAPPFSFGGIPPSPAAPAAPPSGLGGILQGLMGGGSGGGLDIPGMIGNAQKFLGAVNQAGEVFKNVGPMLQMLRGLNVSDVLTDADNDFELNDQPKTNPKTTKKKRKKKKRVPSSKRRRKAKLAKVS